ncbi:MAG: hypothetical protein QGH42_11180 [Kiritimatiellia bacterium]|jgi:magnesium-transporting ATPase (P-type)|nr:hypothetical protein [Kiritimatiellia bacterium]MDP6810015.1 hypothetical protein [Kiritimatiellia bacterium]MDP7024786.1 hypothetical protein [Kiritimatiellia bacterium]
MSQPSQPPVKRSNIFSNPRVQWRIVLTFSAIALVFAATSWYVSLGAIDAVHSEVDRLDLTSIQERDLHIIAREQRTVLNIQLMIQTFAAFVVLTMAAVVLSHHIGGPLHQLSAYLAEVVEGEVQPRRIGFRHHDFFEDLPGLFNAFQAKFGILKEEPRAPAGED